MDTDPKLLDVKIGKLLAQVIDFWKIVDPDVRIVGISDGIVLMIALGWIEPVERRELSHNFV